MKLQIAALVLACAVVSISGMIGNKCWKDDDCGGHECCAGMSYKTSGACAFQPRLGQKCNPWIYPSSKTQCRCILGTTCAEITNKDPSNPDRNRKFRCAKFVLEPDEIEPEERF